MLISVSDSVSREVSGSQAVAVAPEGLSGDLNTKDLDTPFFVMWHRRNLKLSLNQVCLLVLSLQLVLTLSELAICSKLSPEPLLDSAD